MPDIVISEFMDEAVAREILGDFELIYDPTLVDDREALLASLTDARAIVVRNRTIVDQELLDRGPHLKVVGRLGVHPADAALVPVSGLLGLAELRVDHGQEEAVVGEVLGTQEGPASKEGL